MSKRAWLRAGLVLLVAVEAPVGIWQYFFPRSFYDNFPTVSLDPPYNEHLMTDVGGLTLAIAVIVAFAAVYLEHRLVCAAMAGYLVFAVTHVVFHATHLDGFSTADAVEVLTSLGVAVVLPIAILVLARRISRDEP